MRASVYKWKGSLINIVKVPFQFNVYPPIFSRLILLPALASNRTWQRAIICDTYMPFNKCCSVAIPAVRRSSSVSEMANSYNPHANETGHAHKIKTILNVFANKPSELTQFTIYTNGTHANTSSNEKKRTETNKEQIVRKNQHHKIYITRYFILWRLSNRVQQFRGDSAMCAPIELNAIHCCYGFRSR